MRHRNRGRCALALALSLGGLGLARGAEPAWWNRLFRPAAEKTEAAALRAAAPAGPSLGAQLTDAYGTLQRRQEVCQKLREIAHDTDDDALWRKADQLDQRAWDAYTRQTGKLKGAGGVGLDEAVLQQRLGVDAAEARSRLTAPLAGARDAAAGQAAAREE